jgi:hypothetical protein
MGKSSLDGPTQTLDAIYRMAQSAPASYFHDVLSGSNGYKAVTGYDDSTGIGTPIANRIVAGLVGWNGAGTTGGVAAATIMPSSTVVQIAAHSNALATPVAPPAQVGPMLSTELFLPAGVVSIETSTPSFWIASPQVAKTSLNGIQEVRTSQTPPESNAITDGGSMPVGASEVSASIDPAADRDWPFGPDVETVSVSDPRQPVAEDSPSGDSDGGD